MMSGTYTFDIQAEATDGGVLIQDAVSVAVDVVNKCDSAMILTIPSNVQNFEVQLPSSNVRSQKLLITTDAQL